MMSKRYMVRCDMEGASGVVDYDQVVPGTAGYAYGQECFMSDLVSLLRGLGDGGADEIVVYDEHYDGRNVRLGEVPAGVTVICGKPPYRDDWPGGLDDSFSGMILLGLHARAGTGHLLHHTYEPDIAELSLNGRVVGEIGMEAAIAGDCGVPTVMVVGDTGAIEEAEALMPGVVGLSVKESLGEGAGACMPLVTTRQRVREGARRLVQSPPEIEPFHVPGPVALHVVLRPGGYRAAARKLHEAWLDESTLVVEAASATRAWADYWQLKLRAQALASGGMQPAHAGVGVE